LTNYALKDQIKPCPRKISGGDLRIYFLNTCPTPLFFALPMTLRITLAAFKYTGCHGGLVAYLMSHLVGETHSSSPVILLPKPSHINGLFSYSNFRFHHLHQHPASIPIIHQLSNPSTPALRTPHLS